MLSGPAFMTILREQFDSGGVVWLRSKIRISEVMKEHAHNVASPGPRSDKQPLQQIVRDNTMPEGRQGHLPFGAHVELMFPKCQTLLASALAFTWWHCAPLPLKKIARGQGNDAGGSVLPARCPCLVAAMPQAQL